MNSTELPDEYDETIHHDARNGYVTSLKVYLEHKPECINKLYQYGESTWTILLAACYYEQEAIVQMLITQFKANVEIEGDIVNKISKSPQIIEGASPLYAAAFVNNFSIVRFLVEHGLANVNHLTKEHSAPLRAACYHGNFEMVKFLIHHGANPHQKRLYDETNLMLIVSREYIDLVSYFVDEMKCDLNEQNRLGETALHIAVENNSIRITKLLIHCGALNLRDKSRNITPLMWAATHGRINAVAAFDGYCSDLEWIEARELLGSSLAGCIPFIEDMDLAVEYLTLAFEARTTKNIRKLRAAQTLKVFDNRRECESLEDLNQLVSFGSREAFYIEALLIQERLLGTINKDYHDSLRHIGKTLTNSNHYDVCLRLWFYELDLRRQHGIVFNEQDLRSFAVLFDRMLLLNNTRVSINDLDKMLIIITDELSLVQDNEITNYNLVTLLHLMTISAELLLNEDHKPPVADCQLLLKHIRSIVNRKYITSETGLSLLHLCCNENTEALQNIVSYPCAKTVRLLVFCGADVDAMDSARNTALHILIRNSDTTNTTAIIDFLCNSAGAHLDFADFEGNPPVEYHAALPSPAQTMVKRLREKMGVRSLKCHCARRIKYGRLPYQNYLSSSLVNFVYKH